MRFSGAARFLAIVGLAMGLSACGAARSSGAGSPPNGAARAYSTDVRAGGVGSDGASRQALELVEAELVARGDRAEPDGVLANTADEVLRSIYASGKTASSTSVESVARRFGFAGIVLGFAAVGVDSTDAPRFLHELFASVPGNRRVNRYGIVAGHGSDVGIALGVVEVSLDDFPRAMKPGETLHLTGDVARSYERASVFATSPDGSVRELPMPARAIDVRLALPVRGTYKVEVMGYGKSGPVVVANVPIRVGEPEPESAVEEPSGTVDPSLSAEAAEARLIVLLNETRTKAHLPPLTSDGSLRAVALAHSLDMATHDFFGHVSPATGSFEQRARHAGLRGSKFGECLALEVTPEGAHAGLLQSPAHRATMLDPAFTHVGIGVAFREQPLGRRALVATLFFARFPPAAEAELSAEQVLASIQGYRKAKELPPLALDPVLSASARAGAKALDGAPTPSQERGVQAAQAELRRQVNRTKRGRVVCFSIVDIIERSQLASQATPLSPLAVSVGVGVSRFQAPDGPRLMVLLALEGEAGKPIDCK